MEHQNAFSVYFQADQLRRLLEINLDGGLIVVQIALGTTELEGGSTIPSVTIGANYKVDLFLTSVIVDINDPAATLKGCPYPKKCQ